MASISRVQKVLRIVVWMASNRVLLRRVSLTAGASRGRRLTILESRREWLWASLGRSRILGERGV
ncbi:hypothetical protein D3C71_2177760 [compost metagenome]